MKKIIGVFLFICFAVLLVGCKKSNKYHAKIYYPDNQIISDEVLFNNKVKEAHYVVRKEDGTYEPITDDEAPVDRTFVIQDQTTFESYIKKDTISVDFSNQTVLVYFYLTYYHGRQLHLSKVNYENGNVTVNFYDKGKKGYKDNSGPSAGYAVVVLDKLDVKQCTFNYTSK